MDNRQRILDWKYAHDPRSRNFLAVAGLENFELRSRVWNCNAWLDQGREGACVGFGWSHELCAYPKPFMVDDTFAQQIYHRARQLDDEPGENYEGTSVLAGIKAVQEYTNSKGLPLIGEYRWAYGVHDVVKTIAHRGPVVLGIDWYENMYDPDENNFIHAEGPIAGGHCILANAFAFRKMDPDGPATYDNIDMHRSRVRLHNSWGKDWGVNGESRISLVDLEKLLEHSYGEACIPMYRTM